MKRIIIFTTILAAFLFSFTLMNSDEKVEESNIESQVTTKNTDIQSDINSKLENIDELDFSKIEIAKENPDFDAHGNRPFINKIGM